MLTEQPGSVRPLHTDRKQMHEAVRTGRAHLGIFTLHVRPADGAGPRWSVWRPGRDGACGDRAAMERVATGP